MPVQKDCESVFGFPQGGVPHNLFHNAAIIVPDPAKEACVGASREFLPENRSFGPVLGGSQYKEMSGVYTSR